MRYFKVLILLLIFTSAYAQDTKLLLSKKLISLSETPIYSRITEDIDGQIEFKKQFKYLEDIDIYSITYLSDGLKIKGLLVKPKVIDEKLPCIIYNRGGNRDFGALKLAQGVTILGQIAKEGYVVIASQYRGNAGSEGKEEFGGKDVNDVTILTDVLKEIEGANTAKIGMYGWSRGGMMTYIALTKSSNIKAAVVGGAITDNFESIKDRPKMETGVLSELIPNYADNKNA